MNFEQYKKEFIEEASKAGYSEQNIQRCLTYAEKLFIKNVPVIYNTTHLSALVGYKKEYLKKAVFYTNHFYRDFDILKKNGKKRLISEPLPSLKEIQIWILKNILYKVNVSAFAKAYKPNVSIIENLKFHKNQPKVFTLDLENFFSSIKVESIEQLFLQLEYSPLISNLLSKLCCRENALPQGAPTSPYLSNMYFNPADDIISKHCTGRKIRYTRYADDLTFSGDFDEKELLCMVDKTVKDLGLQINKSKTKLMRPNTRQIVTGIVVNEKPQVLFKKRNEIRQSLYFIKKFGFDDHANFKKITKVNYLEHLFGQINFILQINKDDKEFLEYKAVLLNLKMKRSLIN